MCFARSRMAKAATAKQEPDETGGVQLRSFAFWNAAQITELRASQVTVGAMMGDGGVQGFVTRIELIGDLVMFDVCADLDGQNPRRFIVHASSGYAQVARPGECEKLIEAMRGMT